MYFTQAPKLAVLEIRTSLTKSPYNVMVVNLQILYWRASRLLLSWLLLASWPFGPIAAGSPEVPSNEHRGSCLFRTLGLVPVALG